MDQTLTPLTDKHYSLNLIRKMTSAEVVKTSFTSNISFQNYPHPDNQTIQTNDCIVLKDIVHFSNVLFGNSMYTDLLLQIYPDQCFDQEHKIIIKLNDISVINKTVFYFFKQV